MKASQSKAQLSFSDTAPRSAPVIPLRKQKRKRTKAPGVIEQIKCSFEKGSRLATGVGLVLGGFVPAASYVVCHQELQVAQGWRYAALLALIGGGLLFSAKSVWLWSAEAFGDKWKASGFVGLLEGAMVLSEVRELSLASLALLIAVNGLATGVILARGGA